MSSSDVEGPRRSTIIRLALVALVCLATAIAWATAVALHTHEQMHWLFRSNTLSHHEIMHRLVELGQPSTSMAAPQPPSALADGLFGAQQGITVLALSLLGVALVSTGRRIWAAVVVVAVAVLPAALEGMTVAGDVLSPVDLSSAQAGWWPWSEVVLEVAVIALPVATAAVLLRSSRTVNRPTLPVLFTGLLMTGAALVWIAVDSAGLAFDVRPSLSVAGIGCLVALGAGLISARLARRGLLVWAGFAAGLLGAQAVLSSGVLDVDLQPSVSPVGLLLRIAVLAIGPAIILAYPRLERLRGRRVASAAVGPVS